MRTVKQNPFITFTQIRNELEPPIATSTIRKRLIAANLKTRNPVHLLNSGHLKRRIAFARKFIKDPDIVWRNILWTDETKIVQFDHGKEKQCVRRPPK